jgi:hypothetical protein
MATQTTHQQASGVTMAPVSKNSVTIAGEPELYLSTPEPEVTSAVFTFPAGSVFAMDDAPSPGLWLRS